MMGTETLSVQSKTQTSCDMAVIGCYEFPWKEYDCSMSPHCSVSPHLVVTLLSYCNLFFMLEFLLISFLL